MEGFRGEGKKRYYCRLYIEKFSGYKTEVEERIKERKRQALRIEEKEEKKHIQIYGGLREDVRMKTCLHNRMDHAKKLQNAIS